MNEEILFHEALAKPDAERAAFLDAACGGDTALRQRVEMLVRAHANPASFLQAPAVAVATVDECMNERPGTVIGPYKLLEQIGEGGFGVVFMAEQTQPVRRKVALKILKPGMDTRQVVARFEAERQALAIMDHPNIAKVHDGGATPSGRPYFVMELVKGTPITEFCDQNHLTPRQRLELFIPVCQAVQHAHQKGIIHRDLKPSNVLVSRHDATPVVKVIDFGVAKALGQELTDKTLFTGIAQMIGTPLYMSPEQAGMSDLDIDTRSDIYSLGVLLYELLTGTTPFDKERFKKAAYDEIRRIIREEEPPRPSTRLSESKDSLPSISAQRHTEPAKLTKLVRGELDWIVMKALEKDRNRRYETASAFAADVGRYLKDEPVLACPPSVGYRVRKFARRNKTALAVAGLILFCISLLGGGGGWAVRDRIAREEEVAKERLDRQQRLTAQVELILADVERLEREQKWPEAQATAERAEVALAGGEADQATTDRVRQTLADLQMVARLEKVRLRLSEHATLGETLHQGAFDHAEMVRGYAAAFREYGLDIEALPAEQTAGRLRSRTAFVVPLAAALDDWAGSCRLVRQERLAEGLWALASAVDPDPWRMRVRQAVAARDPPGLVALTAAPDTARQPPHSQLLLARALQSADRLEQAIVLLERAAEAHPGDFWIHFELAHLNHSRKRQETALRHYSIARALRPQSSQTWTSLGVALYDQKKVDEAIACYRKAIELDPKDATAHYNRGVALYDQKKLDEAVADYRAAIELAPKFVRAHNNLGNALREQEKLDEAITEYRTAIELDSKHATAHHNLGRALADQKKFDEAITQFRKAIELDPNSAAAHTNLGTALRLQGKLEEAIAEYRKAIAILPDNAEAHCNLGLALQQQGKFHQALEELHRGHELGSQRPGWPYPSAQWVREAERLVELDAKLASILKGEAKPANAGECLELAVLCVCKKLNRAAAQLCAQAFAKQPELADDLGAQHRYNAACAAALAGCGQGKDADQIDAKERVRLRRQALDWLRADLTAWGRLLGKEPDKTGPALTKTMQHWQQDSDFAGVRGSQALAMLPEAERSEWQKLWEDVGAMLKRARGIK